MESLTRSVLKYIIKTIYVLNHEKGKTYVLNQVSEAIKSKIISRKQVYRLLDRLEKEGNFNRKSGSGSPKKLSQISLKNLKKSIMLMNMALGVLTNMQTIII